MNRITNVLAGGSLAASYGFDPNGNLQSIHYANGATNVCHYDALNRLTNSVWKSNALTLASFYYQLGATGNRTNLTETLLTSVTNRTYAWTYDPLYRLINESISSLGSAAYGLDKVGNRTNRTVGLDSLPAQNFSYGSNDWLASDAYDSNGNTLWTTNGANITGPYYYDVENRLTNFNNSVYLRYNGDGIRVSKVANGTNFFYLVDDRNPSGYAQVLEEWTASGGTTNLSHVYNYGLALVSQQQGPTIYYFIPDGHGSTRLLTEGSGAVANAFTYDAYGNLIASNASPQTAFLYCGEQFDSEAGTYYLRARNYIPGTGRFPTMDANEGDQQDPLSLHEYLYSQDNPVNAVDPSGHDGESLDSFRLSINFGNIVDSIYALVLTVEAAQYDPIQYDPYSLGSLTPKHTFTINKDPNPPGSKRFTALDGSTFLAPDNADYVQVYRAGQSLRSKYDIVTIDRNVGHYGKFDYQRNKGQGYLQDTVFYRAYTDASNYGVGVYMNGATFTLNDTLKIASDFAKRNSSNAGDPRQARWQTRGWNAAQAGTPNGK